MENKPSGIFGFHSQQAHDQCEKEFSKFQPCIESNRFYTKPGRTCMAQNNDLMQCLEDKEPTVSTCIPPLNAYRECYMKWGENGGWCSKQLEALERCKADPEKFEYEELYRYRGGDWKVLRRLS